MVADGLFTGEDPGSGRTLVRRPFYTDDVEVGVETGGVAQYGPAARVRYDGTLRCVSFYSNVLFGRWYLTDLTEDSRIIYDSNVLPVSLAGGDEPVLRVIDAEANGFLNGDLALAAPIPAELLGRTRHGMHTTQADNGDPNTDGIRRFWCVCNPDPIEDFDAQSVEGSATTIEQGATTSLAVPIPANPVAGETLVAYVTVNNAGTITTAAADWVRVGQGGQVGGPQVCLFTKVSDGTEAGTVTFTKTGSAGIMLGTMFRMSGANVYPTSLGNTGSFGFTTRVNTGTTNMASQSFNVQNQKIFVLWAGYRAANTSVTPPNGYDLISETGSGGSAGNLVIASRSVEYVPSETGMNIPAATGTAGSSGTSVVIHGGVMPNPPAAIAAAGL